MPESPSDVYTRFWNPRDYLRQYYATSHVPEDELANMAFFQARQAEFGRRHALAIEVGCGPTLHHAAWLAPHVDELHLADYLQANLEEVGGSLAREPGSHDWSVYLNGVTESGKGVCSDRLTLLRQRITRLVTIDLCQPLPAEYAGAYDLVASYYCVECIAEDRKQWRACLARLCSMVAPGGVLLLSAVRRCQGYQVFQTRFPAVPVDHSDFASELVSFGFDSSATRIEAVEIAEWNNQGIDGIVCVWAQKDHQT